jgi:hypothetical protein
MKKFSLIIEKKRQELKETELIIERNRYLDFSKKYNKDHGVSGPFDKKFKGDKKAQKEYMDGLSMAWEEYKKKKDIKNKSDKKDFSFKKKMNESKSSDMAKQMIGDGGDPNYHFVTMCDDYMFEKDDSMVKYSKETMAAPLKIKTTPDFGSYTFGPFMNLEESKMFAESIELDEINGPRMVTIEDRKNGEVFAKFLSCKMQPVWDEHIEENSDSMGEDDNEEEDPNTEYTYGDEDEGSGDISYEEEDGEEE